MGVGPPPLALYHGTVRGIVFGDFGIVWVSFSVPLVQARPVDWEDRRNGGQAVEWPQLLNWKGPLETSKFIKTAHKYIVFRDDKVVPSDSSLLRALDAAGRLAVLSTPLLIQGRLGTGKKGMARLIAECDPRCSFPEAQGFVEFDCLADDISDLRKTVAQAKKDRAIIFIRNIDRNDDGVDPLLNFINAVLSSAASDVPRLVCSSNTTLLLLEPKIRGQWDGMLSALHREKLRTTLLPLLKYFKGATLSLSALSHRPWDIPPIAIDLLRKTDITQLTLNVLDYFIRAAWRENRHGLKRIIVDLASLSQSSGIINFDLLLRSRPPEEDQELLQTITSPEARVARSQWLETDWLIETGNQFEVTGQVIDFDTGEKILFDVGKMRDIFEDKGILINQRAAEVPNIAPAESQSDKTYVKCTSDFSTWVINDYKWQLSEIQARAAEMIYRAKRLGLTSKEVHSAKLLQGSYGKMSTIFYSTQAGIAVWKLIEYHGRRWQFKKNVVITVDDNLYDPG